MGAHSAPRKRSPRYAILAAVAIVGAAAWWVLFLRSDGGVSQESDAARRSTVTEEGTTSTGTSEAQKRSAMGTVETFEVFASRDPFSPLVGAGNGGSGSGSDEDEATVVRLIDAAADGVPGAQIEVNGTVHAVPEGETFADNFKLLSVSGECTSLLFGDDQFTICEGERILR